MATVGRACLILALVTCAYGIVASIYGARARRPDWAESGRRSVYAMAVLATLSFAILEIAFLRSDFSFAVVASHSSTTTPFWYRAAAAWSSQEGSLLLWMWLLSVWASLVLFLTRRRLRDVAPYATAVLLGFGAFFGGLLALAAWFFLGIGILLGARWSYSELGWGGYWAWDPVENASLLPWLTGTAFIHSVIVQERRGMLRVWNLSLVIATFCLTILGTFLTRSGVLDSVHAFTESDIGPWLLTFLGATAATSIGLLAWRGDRLRAPGRIDSAVSRESAFLANNLLFAGLAFVVLLGTVFPLLAEALQGRRISVGEPYFDRMTTPLGLV